METLSIDRISHRQTTGRKGPGTVLVWVSWVTAAGGLERVALSLANGLAARGLQVVLAGPFSNNPDLQARINPRVNYIEYDPIPTPSGLLRTHRFLRELIRSKCVDVVSAHGSVFPLLPLRTPVVWTEHGLRYGFQNILAGSRGFAWRWVGARLRQGNWHLVTVSKFVLDCLRSQFGFPERCARVIYNGVPASESLRALPRPRFEAPYRLGYVGRLEPEKHPLDLFEMDRHLQREAMPCKWLVFGAGSMLEELRERAAREGEGRFEFHGVRDVVEAFGAIDALVFTSRGEMEGLPTVLLEADLARRPAVAWRATCIPEAAGSGALLVSPPFTPERLAGGLVRMLRGGQKHSEPVTGRWSMDTMLDQYEGVLAEAYATRRPRY